MQPDEARKGRLWRAVTAGKAGGCVATKLLRTAATVRITMHKSVISLVAEQQHSPGRHTRSLPPLAHVAHGLHATENIGAVGLVLDPPLEAVPETGVEGSKPDGHLARTVRLRLLTAWERRERHFSRNCAALGPTLRRALSAANAASHSQRRCWMASPFCQSRTLSTSPMDQSRSGVTATHLRRSDGGASSSDRPSETHGRRREECAR